MTFLRALSQAWRSLPNLEILVADTATLFAMKCAAARTDEDASDIRVLARVLGRTSSEDALRLVEGYYPAERLPGANASCAGGTAR